MGSSDSSLTACPGEELGYFSDFTVQDLSLSPSLAMHADVFGNVNTCDVRTLLVMNIVAVVLGIIIIFGF